MPVQLSGRTPCASEAEKPADHRLPKMRVGRFPLSDDPVFHRSIAFPCRLVDAALICIRSVLSLSSSQRAILLRTGHSSGCRAFGTHPAANGLRRALPERFTHINAGSSFPCTIYGFSRLGMEMMPQSCSARVTHHFEKAVAVAYSSDWRS